MSIKHSEATCDWCGRKVDEGDSLACRPCYEELEVQVGAWKKEADRVLGLLGELADVSPLAAIRLLHDIRDFGKEEK